MTNQIPFHSNNVEFNPLFAEMKKRFCEGGTIAEKLTARADEYKKHSTHRVSGEEHMKHANFLPKSAKKHIGVKKSIFSLHRLATVCMALLISCTVLLSFATIGEVQNGFSDPHALLEDQHIVTDDSLIFGETTPFAMLNDKSEAPSASLMI